MEALLSAQDCCNPCDEAIITQTPGPAGNNGAPGIDGANGENAYTTLTNPFTMPVEGDSDVADVVNSDWMAIGQKVFIGRPDGAARGTFEVVAKPDSISVELLNVEDAGTSAYLDNSPAGTIFASASVVSPSGLQGPDGSVPGGVLLAANNLADVASAATSRTSLGLGTAAVKTAGVADTNLAPVDDAAFTAGEMVRATAIGIESVPAATGRTALGLGTMAVQDDSAVAITGGSLIGTIAINTSSLIAAAGGLTTSGDLKVNGPLFTAPSTLQTLGPANLIQADKAKIRVISSGGAVTMTSTPTISAGTADGQRLLIKGTSAADTVTLQDDGSLAGSKLELGAASRTLGLYSQIELSWDTTDGKWVEISFAAN